MYGMDKIYVHGDLYMKKLLKTVKNQFWKDSIRSLLIIVEQQPYQGMEALLTTPLWYNSKMIPDMISSWMTKGITTIGDLVDENGEIRSMEYIQSKWDIKSDFLLHLRLKKKIQLLTTQQNKTYL